VWLCLVATERHTAKAAFTLPPLTMNTFCIGLKDCDSCCTFFMGSSTAYGQYSYSELYKLDMDARLCVMLVQC
jgi:hypothetical protein